MDTAETTAPRHAKAVSAIALLTIMSVIAGMGFASRATATKGNAKLHPSFAVFMDNLVYHGVTNWLGNQDHRIIRGTYHSPQHYFSVRNTANVEHPPALLHTETGKLLEIQEKAALDHDRTDLLSEALNRKLKVGYEHFATHTTEYIAQPATLSRHDKAEIAFGISRPPKVPMTLLGMLHDYRKQNGRSRYDTVRFVLRQDRHDRQRDFIAALVMILFTEFPFDPNHPNQKAYKAVAQALDLAGLLPRAHRLPDELKNPVHLAELLLRRLAEMDPVFARDVFILASHTALADKLSSTATCPPDLFVGVTGGLGRELIVDRGGYPTINQISPIIAGTSKFIEAMDVPEPYQQQIADNLGLDVKAITKKTFIPGLSAAKKRTVWVNHQLALRLTEALDDVPAERVLYVIGEELEKAPDLTDQAHLLVDPYGNPLR